MSLSSIWRVYIPLFVYLWVFLKLICYKCLKKTSNGVIPFNNGFHVGRFSCLDHWTEIKTQLLWERERERLTWNVDDIHTGLYSGIIPAPRNYYHCSKLHLSLLPRPASSVILGNLSSLVFKNKTELKFSFGTYPFKIHASLKSPLRQIVRS